MIYNPKKYSFYKKKIAKQTHTEVECLIYF